MVSVSSFAPVAITTRNGLDESVHFGAVVGLNASGGIEFAVGDPHAVIYPRSSNKPMQAVAMLRSGLKLPAELLAIVCASHDGTPMHTDAVLRILAQYGLRPEHLANTADFPIDKGATHEIIRAGGSRSRLLMNCSGKHAGMLATCTVNGWPHDSSYLAVDHPLQQTISATVDELCGEAHAHIGVDGCGAPAHAMSLVGLARAYAAIAVGAAGVEGDAVYQAMTRYPEMVGGASRDVTLFMRHVPGLLAKDGADGVFAAALPDGRAIALKIADGGDRARAPLMVAALRALGVDVSEVAPLVAQHILGHGKRVGVVKARRLTATS